MRTYRTERIQLDREYTPATLQRDIGIPRSTVYDWIRSRRLVCQSGHRTTFTGRRVLEAFRRMPLPGGD